MKVNKGTYRKHLYLSLLLPVLTLAGCMDDPLMSSDPEGNPDAITFSANMVDALVQGNTRGEGTTPLHEPLVLTGDGDASPLYLHTFETNRIGYRPGDTADAETRGYQVTQEVGDLLKRHTNFKVLGKKTDESNYLGWVNAHIANPDNPGDNRWYTDRTEYWPAKENLTFYAVSPSTEFANLSNLATSEGVITFDYQARKGDVGSNNDAEKQEDLLLAANECNKNTRDGKVPLNFHHALSAVKFAVRDVLGGEVVNIKIAGVKSAGHCRLEKNTEGKYQFTWSAQTGEETYSQDFNYTLSDRVVDPSDDTQDEVLNIGMPEKTFMMIPQQIPAEAEIIITLKRNNLVTGAGLQETITVKGKIRDNEITEWKPGHEYIYIISTSKDNWVYVFDAVGNEAGGTTENIFMYSPTREIFSTYGDNGYFKVISYRYRANDQNNIQALPWTASHGGSLSYKVEGDTKTAYPIDNPEQKNVTAEQWITDTFATPLSGEGSPDGKIWEQHDLKVLSHYISTDWRGDEVMQAYPHYSGYSKSKPYDLSKFGNAKLRTTANCYIVDRGGWYCFPLVYGNAVVDDHPNTSSYECANTSITANRLYKMLDYNNQEITQPYIKNVPANAAAQLIWTDAYNMVSDIELTTINGERMIRFYIDSNDLQQGNAIIALTDGPDLKNSTVIWSWHIWATEHWLDPTTRLPHVYDTGNSSFNTFTPNYKTGMRERGDVPVTWNQHGQSFMMSAYNLGWCDPKQVIYLQRENVMNFVQYLPGKTKPSGKTDALPIIQEGDIVDYKFGNNTYYQWGRKDPMRGFFNHEQKKKVVFGPRQAQTEDQENITIKDGIRNPNIFYGNKGTAGSLYEDWLINNGYYNLWNNHKNSGVAIVNDDSYRDDMWCHTKTVYDPSPAGYMVPNAGVLRVVQKKMSDIYTADNEERTEYREDQTKWDGETKSRWNLDHTVTVSQRDFWSGGNWPENKFNERLNGKLIDPYNYKVWGNGVANDNNAIFFSSTGNRWWTSDWKIDGIGGGGNFGKNVSYAWSNRYVWESTRRMACGMAIGLDTNNIDEVTTLLYYVGGQFLGRRAMGRPVRAIREP